MRLRWKDMIVFGMLATAAFGFAATQAAVQGEGEEYPPDAKPGECWAKCVTKPKYETYTEQIRVKEASKRVVVTPATYEAVTERVMVKPASKRLEVIPAVYGTETEQAMVKEASTRLEKIPAVYEDTTERIEVSPATTRWEKGKATAACLSANPEDCRVWCLVEVPAQYKTINKRVLKTPETTREVAVPAQYTTITKRIMTSPATTREIEVPAEYRTVTRTVVKTPASTREVDVPAEYSTVTRRREVTPGGVGEWRRVICENQLTSGKVRQIQAALKEKGYDPGPLDNMFGTRTKDALTRYQREKGLPEGNLDYETLRSLGIE